ncbi:TetR family transcriptional regulator [Franconibacter helveticus]|uniref:TetR family transcriptional regulator n=1 Tax=Franconibacter helveticus TaxID=357240 RepID=UPI000DA1EA2C|nr:TetR family transcriptional regulator [Franconibacter helveticus]
MSYLHREERRETILQAATEVALSAGFAAMTVRRIAAQAGVAAGQVHHHFASSTELKAQAFLRIIQTKLKTADEAQPAGWRDRLLSMLGYQEEAYDPYLRLWREAPLLAEKEPAFKAAYAQSMEIWHGELVRIIREHESTAALADSAENIAWRLIALVCGLDGLLIFEIGGMTTATFDAHLEKAIAREFPFIATQTQD